MKQSNIVLGIIWILANNLILCLQSATIKGLSHSLHNFQILFLYKLTVFIVAAITVMIKGVSLLRTRKLHLYFVRSLLSISAAQLFVYALKSVKLANAMAIGFTEPLFATILAILFLHEDTNKYMITALVVGFIGAMIVIRPNGEDFASGTLFVLAAALIWSLDNIVIKLLGKTEGSTQYLFYISFFSTIFAAPFAYYKWQPVEISQIQWLVALAVFYLLHILAVFKAFQYAKITQLAPCDFSRLVFSAIVGYLVFGEKVDMWSIYGSLLIISSSVYLVWSKEKMVIKDKIKSKVQSYRSKRHAS
jgi:drug/metabolite transporter (DMT)-like permease